jgi:hypothetical protein
MTAEPQRVTRGIEFPDGRDPSELIRELNHSAFVNPTRDGRDYRRLRTQLNPLLFAVHYFPHYLDPKGTGVMSFCDFHLDAYWRAEVWADRDRGRRYVDVAPRGSAKSVLYALVLPLWALAHGHRKFFLYLTYGQEQAVGKLADLRMELDTNERLMRDFPELGAPPRMRGARNNSRAVTSSGATIAAAGLGATSLGIRAREHRPDLVVIDDPQPLTDNTPKEKAKIESRIINEILPMGERETVYQLAGTTTMYGCLMHEAVRAAHGEATAPWIAAHGWRSNHWRAILDEGTAGERSWWPRKRSLRWLQRKRDNPDSRNYYALNYANDPALAPTMVGYWSEDMFVHNDTLDVDKRLLYMDPAMTDGRKSDQTAIVVAGIERCGQRVVIEYAEQGRWLGDDRQARCREVTARVAALHPGSLRQWWVESNQGGAEWRRWLRPPAGVSLHLDHVQGAKKDRIEGALRLYQRGRVVHDHRLEALETQAMQWTPHSSRDDLLDALGGALRQLLPSG